MTDYTWFKLLVRGIGLTIVGFALPGVLWGATQLLTMSMDATSLRMSFIVFGGPTVGSALQLAFGLYLFFGGRWIIARSIRSLYHTCASCGYDVRGHADPLCPECGVMLPGRAAAKAPEPAPAATP